MNNQDGADPKYSLEDNNTDKRSTDKPKIFSEKLRIPLNIIELQFNPENKKLPENKGLDTF